MKRPARGAVLVSAIFLIVVLVALGASMATLTSQQQHSSGKSIVAMRAYYGAKAGLEWGIQQAVSSAASCAASTGPFTLAAPALSGVSVTVTCSQSTFGAGNNTFYIVSTAIVGSPANPGGLDYAERRMEATVSNIP
jgi:MSHA biogenesis protein MshP